MSLDVQGLDLEPSVSYFDDSDTESTYSSASSYASPASSSPMGSPRPSSRLASRSILSGLAASSSRLDLPDGASTVGGLPVGSGKGSFTDPNSNVRVCCRFRPPSTEEETKGGRLCVEFGEEEQTAHSVQLATEDRDYTFSFHRIFRPYSTQEELFVHTGRPTVDSVMSGFNAAIIAYGQTGSGKTYTMLGDQDNPGLIPRVMQTLFERVELSASDEIEFDVRASYIEIYMELVKDLLNPDTVREKESMKIREDHERGLWLPEAAEVPLASLGDVFGVLDRGNLNRRVASTRSNERSSRSHAIFLVTVFRRNRATGINKVSQLYLVDLAGSERSKNQFSSPQQMAMLTSAVDEDERRQYEMMGSSKTKTVAQRKHDFLTQRNEANKINQSLLALGNVIFALCENVRLKEQHKKRKKKKKKKLKASSGGSTTRKGKGGKDDGKKKKKKGVSKVHVPYRSSKLTRLLQNTLGGNAKTTLIICTSPHSYNCKETLNTLRFGDRTMQIRNTAVVNEQVSPAELKYMLKKSREENKRLRGAIRELEQEMMLMQEVQLAIGDNSAAAAAAAPAAGDKQVVASHRSTQDVERDLRQLVVSFMCPLSKAIMIDPVIALDGYSYDRRAIASYLRSKSVSPMTGEIIPNKLIPNYTLSTLIRKFFPDLDVRQSKRLVNKFLLISLDSVAIIMRFCDFKSVTRLASVNKEFHSLATEEQLWLSHIHGMGLGPINQQQLRNEACDSYRLLFRVLYENKFLSARRQQRQRARENPHGRPGVRLIPNEN